MTTLRKRGNTPNSQGNAIICRPIYIWRGIPLFVVLSMSTFFWADGPCLILSCGQEHYVANLLMLYAHLIFTLWATKRLVPREMAYWKNVNFHIKGFYYDCIKNFWDKISNMLSLASV